MKNKILSRSDVVETMAAHSSMSCRWWRSLFKNFGWRWDLIWRIINDDHFIIGADIGEGPDHG